jgi:ABC-2 type transport system ATP-binding protein
MIELRRVTKRYGLVTALDDLSFTVRPGHVTGFLGPNGAGKTTTMRIILGLDAPASGTALVGGRRYQQIVRPLRHVGSLLDATAVHAGRTAHDHLLSVARSNGIGRSRVARVLELTGLSAVASQRVGGFSLGMKQRLGIALALLGEPPVLMFDEPVNGLDADGVRWIRLLLRQLAADGHTVLVSSHLMSEMAQTADHLIIIGRGRLLADTPTDRLTKSTAGADVLVRSPRAAELAALLGAAGATARAEPAERAEPTDPADPTESTNRAEPADALAVTGLGAPAIADLAAAHGIAVHELVPRQPSLEQAYLDLTAASTDYRATAQPIEPEASR